MLRTILLVVASTATIVAGYAAYTYQEGALKVARVVQTESPTTLTMPTFDDAGLEMRGAKIHSGTKPYVVVYGADGEPKYQFRSAKWEPVSETEFKLVQPEICVFMPGGQITQVRADEGQMFVERAGGNNFNPKRGYLKGHVMIFIDRTDKAWRRAKPEQAAPEQHPDQIIHIWLDEIRFDLDQSWIKSPGTLRVQSSEAEIEGSGLTLAWNERDNRIERLDIEQGKRMELRRGGSMVSFGLPGQEREGGEAAATTEPAGHREQAKRDLKKTGAMAATGLTVETEKGRTPSAFIERALLQGASANRSLSVDDIYPEKKPTTTQASGRRTARFSDKPASPSKRIQLFGQKDDKGRTGKPRQIDTYHAVFEGNVLVEQRRGLKMLGQLAGADRLELVFDVGERQRKVVQGDSPATQPSDDPNVVVAEAEAKAAKAKRDATGSTTTSSPTSQPEDQTRIKLLWSGRLSLRPVEVPENEKTGRRFDAIASGTNVRVMDRQGEVACRRLIFRNETEQAWLYGTSDAPVRLSSGETRRLQGNEIYVDRRTGIAVVNGPGSMSDTREAFAAVAVPGSEESPSSAQSKPSNQERIELSWSRQVEMDFALGEIKRVDPNTGQEVTKRREYVKQAVFRGAVRMKQGDQGINAEEIVMNMGVPTDSQSMVGPITKVYATGGVVLTQQKDEIHCEKLSVSMTTDEHGRNIPKSATAYGNVLAKQDKRQIQAKDQLNVIIGATRTAPTSQVAEVVAGAIDPAQLARVKELALLRGIRPQEIDRLLQEKGLDAEALRAFAVARNIDPAVINKLIQPKKAKPRVGIIQMDAFGDVVAVDSSQKLDVQAEEIQCSLPDGKNIERATLRAKPNEKARAEFGDYVINGHQIVIDMTRQYAHVPDDGWLRFLTHQDLDGRKLDEPTTTEVRWTKEMRLEGQKNKGEFLGDVSASSQNSELKCDRLSIDFVDLAPAEMERIKQQTSPGRWQMLSKMLSGNKPKPKLSEENFRQRFDKKPVRVLADGNAVVLSSTNDKVDAKRLQSRMRIAGPKLTVDLRNEQLDVTGQGSLLIEDYRVAARDGAAQPAPSGPKDPLMASISGRGPSQTAFTWGNSMTYYMGRNLAVLDRNVNMVHLAGGALALGTDLAKAMNVDVGKMRMKGREATLSCDNLTVEFLRNDRKGGSMPFDRAGAAELKRLIATGNIYLEDTGRSLVGEELTYYRDNNEITIKGTAENEARMFEQDLSKGQLSRFFVAPMIRWNRNTGEIVAPGARIVNQGR